MARVTWNSCKSQYVPVKNGVKQEGDFTIVFYLYIDRLLLHLQSLDVSIEKINGLCRSEFEPQPTHRSAL